MDHLRGVFRAEISGAHHQPIGPRPDQKLQIVQVHAAALAAGLALDESGEQAVQDSLTINGSVPEGILERIVEPSSFYNDDGLNTTSDVREQAYYPSQFQIIFHYTVPGLTQAQGAAFLTALLENYQAYFYRVYGYNLAFEQALRTFDYSSYDYEDAVTILSDNLSGMSRYLRWLESQDTTHFVSSGGVTFSDLAAAIDTLQSENISQISAYVSSNLMTKDIQELIDYYQYRIRDQERWIISWQGRLEALNQLIADYVKDNALIMGSIGSTGETAGYEITQPSAMFNQLINERVDCQTSISRLQESNNYYLERVEILENGTAGGSLATLQQYFNTLDTQMNLILDRTNEAATEFFSTVQLEDAIRIVKEPEKQSTVMRVIRSSLRPGVGAEALIFGCWLLCAVYMAVQPSRSAVSGTKKKAKNRE